MSHRIPNSVKQQHKLMLTELIEIFTLTVFQMILYRGGLVETGARSSVHILETRFQIIKSTG
tara:strand:- start:26 stop:211 length:186 start_codon:yes stop_codon:yes gene_type:complete